LRTKDHRDKQWRPRRIHQWKHRRPRDKGAEGAKIAQALHRMFIAIVQCGANTRAQRSAAKPFVQPRTDSNQGNTAHPFKKGQCKKRCDRNQGQHRQGVDTATCEYAAEDLQHL
jgi:hypothetical protein